MQKKETQKKADFSINGIIIQAVIGFVLALILLFITSVLIYNQVLDMESIPWYSTVICGFGALIAAYRAAKRAVSKKFFAGAAAAATYFVILVFAGLFMYANMLPGERWMIILAACLAGGIAGAIIASAKTGKRFK